MAVSIKTAQFGRNTCPQADFTVEFISETGGEAKYKWTLSWVTYGYTVTSSASKAYSATIDGKTVTSGSFAINGKTTQVISTGEVTIAKGTASRSVPIGLSFAMTFTWNNTSGGTKTASGSFNVGAKSLYTITYNLNGGSGSFANQTKWFGDSVTLHSASPTRAGHTFVRWNTAANNTGTGYAPNSTYSANANVTLYAIWSVHTYTVSYNANGGSGAPGNQTKTYGTNLTLSTTRPTRANYNFLGWATSASGGVAYNPGSTYTNNSAITLYAVWQLAYWKPSVSNFSAQRCDSAGNVSETGTYIRCVFNWNTYHNVSRIFIDYALGGDWGAQKSTQVTGVSGTSGTNKVAIVGGDVSIESTYSVRVWVEDSGGSNYSTVLSIGTVKFPIDVKAGGTGVAFGKVAETNNLLDVGFDMQVRGLLQGALQQSGSTGDARKLSIDGGNYNFNVSPSSGWANGMMFRPNDGSSYLGQIAAFGGANTLDYYFIGKAWDNNLVRIYPDATLLAYKDIKASNVLVSNNTTFTGDIITGASGSSRWVKIGTWTSGGDSTTCCIRIYSGNGYNAGPSQNTMITIMIKDGWQESGSTSNAFGITATPTLYGDSNWVGMSIQGVARAHNVIDVWLYLPWAYWNGNYVFEGQGAWTRSRDVSTSAPSGAIQPMNWELQYPVGHIVVTSTNSNPRGRYGGTWELIEKDFASSDGIGGWSHTSSCSSSDFDFSRSGGTLFLSGGFTAGVQWNDDTIHAGTINFSACGVSRLGADAYFVAYTDAGNSGLMCEIEFDTGRLLVVDNFGDQYISSGRYIKWSCAIPIPTGYKLDAACDRFYWKRTA